MKETDRNIELTESGLQRYKKKKKKHLNKKKSTTRRKKKKKKLPVVRVTSPLVK